MKILLYSLKMCSGEDILNATAAYKSIAISCINAYGKGLIIIT